MTEQERKDAFMQAVMALEAQYGFTIISTVTAKQYGDMLQMEPGPLRLVAIDGWQPVQSEPNNKE